MILSNVTPFCIIGMSAFVGPTGAFDKELRLEGVAIVGDIDINKASEEKVQESVSVSLAEIVLETGWIGYRRVHTTLVKKGVK